ncbi:MULTISPECIES: hypothetical protein [unclassified Herbaspirillum]|uniref:hypothetical protein n=1 Tax=unclassified Herbaspirillum TaxID=2624150 RepID=UPI0011521325|nr:MULTISPECIES: hypothetical protein [unclassified Herbaspirillum]MBB5393826.1 hypothetical protein [Herbaspirillum sp. SJZ102]TQK01317.1 hypothetical protein FB599_3801 [Herbaspirillum sp. SJZ130]TQK05713.1 hypothetical protein FB598_3741 [Herbaspirillum sp. SJZ106]
MSINTLDNGPYVRAIGWIHKQDHSVRVASHSKWADLENPIDFSDTGDYRIKDIATTTCSTDIPLSVMRSSGVARARSAAKGTVFAALLGKQLLETVSDKENYHGNRVGMAVASNSAITPIAWEFETVGLIKGWDKTDTLLLPSSIPSSITTQISATLDTHAAAISFQDGAFGVCAAIEYAHLSFIHQRSDYFLIIGAEEICPVQCNALAALDDQRPWLDGAAGLMLARVPNSENDWQLAFCGNLAEGTAYTLPEDWTDAAILKIEIKSSATLFTSPLVPYALHHLFMSAASKAVLNYRLPGKGNYVLGFTQRNSQS